MSFIVEPFHHENEQAWDRFVMEESANGTFLQTRRFLNYHPEGRFQDASLLVLNEKGAIAAVVPGAVVDRDGKRTFVSHPGSTYGGPVIRSSVTNAKRCIEIVQALEEYLTSKFDCVEYKLTPELFCSSETAALSYAFYYLNYYRYDELSTWVDLQGKTQNNLLSFFRQNKKQDVRKCMHHELNASVLTQENEIAVFYSLLCQNLQKYVAVPVHSLSELLEFKNNRLTNEVRFIGIWTEDRMVAGGMLFLFPKIGLVHTQYLAADLSITEYSPAAFLYYSILLDAIQSGYRALSWGISTEDHGQHLNFGLIESKEGYSSQHALNYTYYKDIGERRKDYEK